MLKKFWIASHVGRHWRLLVLICAAGIGFIRVPSLLTEGRFWAEDGLVYFNHAYHSNNALETLLSPALGYYSIINRAVAFVSASIVPIEFAPLVHCWIAFAFMLLPIGLFLFSNISGIDQPFEKILGASLILFVGPNLETWISLTVSHFYHGLAVAIILVSGSRDDWTKYVRYITLIAGGLNTPVPCFFIPFFWIVWWNSRNREKLIESLLLTVTGIIQFVVVLCSATESGRLDFTPIPFLPFILVVKQVLLPFFGWSIADNFERQVRWLHQDFYWLTVWILPVVYANLLILIYRLRDIVSGMLVCSSLVVSLVSSCTAIAIVTVDKSHLSATLIDEVIGGRYFYLPNVLFFMGLLTLSRKFSKNRAIVAKYVLKGLVLWIVLAGILNFSPNLPVADDYFQGPSWHSEISKWRNDTNYPVQIWPQNWKLILAPEEN